MTRNFILFVFLTFNLSTLIAQEWQTDFNTAKQLASQENKPIILVFQGSDWCAPCIKLDREVWSSQEFESYAKAHYIMLRADFPRRKKNLLSKEQSQANAALADIYNKEGVFPLVVILDQDGTVLGKTGYHKTTPKSYIEELNAMIQ